jgi:hypothetical protein
LIWSDRVNICESVGRFLFLYFKDRVTPYQCPD